MALVGKAELENIAQFKKGVLCRVTPPEIN